MFETYGMLHNYSFDLFRMISFIAMGLHPHRELELQERHRYFVALSASNILEKLTLWRNHEEYELIKWFQ